MCLKIVFQLIISSLTWSSHLGCIWIQKRKTWDALLKINLEWGTYENRGWDESQDCQSCGLQHRPVWERFTGEMPLEKIKKQARIVLPQVSPQDQFCNKVLPQSNKVLPQYQFCAGAKTPLLLASRVQKQVQTLSVLVSINRPIYQSINQPFNQPINQSNSQSTFSQSIKKSTNQSINHSVNIQHV